MVRRIYEITSELLNDIIGVNDKELRLVLQCVQDRGKRDCFAVFQTNLCGISYE